MKILDRFFARKPPPRTADQIATLIEGFANGKGGRWDYFIGTYFGREKVNWAQKECLKFQHEFPHTGCVGWCNEKGFDRLRAIASELRASGKVDITAEGERPAKPAVQG